MINSAQKEERKEYFILSLFILPYIVANFKGEYFLSLPLLYLGIYLFFQILLLTIQNRYLFTDALTNLNNRRRLNMYLDDILKTVSKDYSIGIFMLDVNKFKSINDIYGHVEGDNALKEVANKIKDFCCKHNGFCARYGGDEFCIILKSNKDNYDDLLNSMQNEFKDIKTNKCKNISLSIGGILCDNNSATSMKYWKKLMKNYICIKKYGIKRI